VLENVEMLVLDEADRMLDMGFIDESRRSPTTCRRAPDGDVQRHLHRPRRPPRLNPLRDPKRVDVAPHTDTHAIEQRLHGPTTTRTRTPCSTILTQREVEQALVHEHADRRRPPRRPPRRLGHAVASLHGGMPQAGATAFCRAAVEAVAWILVATDARRAASTCRRSATSSTAACR
jgi:superfamily II DNA/RNA helicase